ncbi:MAG: hypothetical protein ABI960_02390 [Candidatus Eisenbacteria bacterium]
MWLLARRNLAVRPGRTALFLLGFALAVGVMIALLSVGEAIVEQARDKDLVGGGDLVLVPQGTDVDVLKLGGVTAMFSTVPNARFLYRQLLRGPRFSDDVAAASPTWAGRPIYLRAQGRVIQSLAGAEVPALARALDPRSRLPKDWRDSAGEVAFARLAGEALYAEIDRWHRPSAAASASGHWAEWYYFNLADPASGAYAYLSFFVAGDPWAGPALGSLSLQLGERGQPPRRYVSVVPIDSTAVPLDGVGARLGPATVTFEDGRYRLRARFVDRLGGGPVDVDLAVTPEPRAYYPPITIEGTGGFASGYVVPAAIARGDGSITASGERVVFDGVPAYHDHNWGVWKSTRWDWGQVQSADRAFALVYGAVHAPELERAGADGRRFVLVTARDGFLGFLEPRGFEYEGWRAGPLLGAVPVEAPTAIHFEAVTEDDSLSVRFVVEDVAASRPPGDAAEPASARLGAGRAFLQMRGRYEVRGRVGGRAISFEARGAAETFVPLHGHSN